MKLLYITDLHGNEWKFEKTLQIAKLIKADVVINGGDILPIKGNLLKQGDFIINYLDEYFRRYESEGIYYLCLMGNDDLIIFDELFQKTCDKYSHVVNIAQKKFEIKECNFEFIGMNWITDLPFALKDRARKDKEGFVFPNQLGIQVLSTPNGWKEIDDWFSYVENLPTIEDEMNKLVKPSNMRKTIYTIHMPPSNLGLDVCHDGRKVGSRAIYSFFKENQPLLSLHGHIHESPEISGRWYTPLGNTICIQPGQSIYYVNTLNYALIDLEFMKFERHIVKK